MDLGGQLLFMACVFWNLSRFRGVTFPRNLGERSKFCLFKILYIDSMYSFYTSNRTIHA